MRQTEHLQELPAVYEYRLNSFARIVQLQLQDRISQKWPCRHVERLSDLAILSTGIRQRLAYLQAYRAKGYFAASLQGLGAACRADCRYFCEPCQGALYQELSGRAYHSFRESLALNPWFCTEPFFSLHLDDFEPRNRLRASREPVREPSLPLQSSFLGLLECNLKPACTKADVVNGVVYESALLTTTSDPWQHVPSGASH